MRGPARRLEELAHRERRVVAGLMSGTSADSIDVAICSIRGGGIPGPESRGAAVELLGYREEAHDPGIRRAILELDRLDVRSVAELNVRLGEAFAAACAEGLRRAGLPPSELDLVGSHGQTVYHHSSVPGAIKATLQLGDGDVIAERLGVPVVADFRARDIAAGGEGAPISPFADLILFGSTRGTRRAVLNLGGVANVTVLDPEPSAVLGFDTGPANSLIDRLARRLSGGRLACDCDGAIARSGRVDESLVERLLAEDAYLARRPPKSTGFEMYGDAFVDRAARLLGRCDADLMASLTEFTARSIARAFAAFVPPRDEVIAAGGGVRNPALLDRIAALLAPARLLRSDDLGVPGDAREAMAFAILASEAILGHPTSLPSVTGARRSAVLGKLCFPC
ncbi:Anhydro-N-acetylmuramic acid kinase [Aquisphaera giovannonii]|uniref:Anhydro-N-acetylmuramic acid kinase n=1 Tax=Aquisphaera giovannonii TaxID=406548 RepID=A0A5B9WC30_9BACT|nr:anhydro-N-acetylmuramic acid kinase [Aquisphaera giovannonii]QEH38077.1 Anhydro-N-acetylmuramic acid kinase [Aquisphaera giovannonii]